MSKVTSYKCDACDNIVNHATKVYTYGYMYDLCDNCYKDISALEDMKHIHNVAISETLEKLIEGRVVSRDVMLKCINLCLTIGTDIDSDYIKDKQLKKLIDELTDSMLMLFEGLDEAKNNK